MIVFHFLIRNLEMLWLLTVRNQSSSMLYCSSVQCDEEVEKEANSWPDWPCQVLIRPWESAVITTSCCSSLKIFIRGLCTGLHHRGSPWEKKGCNCVLLPKWQTFIPEDFQTIQENRLRDFGSAIKIYTFTEQYSTCSISALTLWHWRSKKQRKKPHDLLEMYPPSFSTDRKDQDLTHNVQIWYVSCHKFNLSQKFKANEILI